MLCKLLLSSRKDQGLHRYIDIKTGHIAGPDSIGFVHLELSLENILLFCQALLFLIVPFGILSNTLQTHFTHQFPNIFRPCLKKRGLSPLKKIANYTGKTHISPEHQSAYGIFQISCQTLSLHHIASRNIIESNWGEVGKTWREKRESIALWEDFSLGY